MHQKKTAQTQVCVGWSKTLAQTHKQKHKRTKMIEPSRRRKARKIFVVCVAALFCCVYLFNNIRNRHYLTRSAILLPKFAPWRHLLKHGDSLSFLELTGMTRECFMMLHAEIRKLEPFRRRLNRRKGRPKLLSLKDEIGLVLFYLTSHLRTKHLCLMFGIVPSVCNDTINRMLIAIITALDKHPSARVRFPTAEEMKRLSELVTKREPTVRDVIGFLDGCHFKISCDSDEREQNKFYNGHYKDTTVNNVFLFCAEGLIRHAAYNQPGSWHDSMVVKPLIQLIHGKIGCHKICVDQGFPTSGDLFDIFVGPISSKRLRKIDPIIQESIKRRSHVYTLLRQASEWGMRALQGSFSRLTAKLPGQKNKRKNIIYAIILLHNFRTRSIGLNQIATVFNPHYEQYINVNGYDKIHRYFVN